MHNSCKKISNFFSYIPDRFLNKKFNFNDKEILFTRICNLVELRDKSVYRNFTYLPKNKQIKDIYNKKLNPKIAFVVNEDDLKDGKIVKHCGVGNCYTDFGKYDFYLHQNVNIKDVKNIMSIVESRGGFSDFLLMFHQSNYNVFCFLHEEENVYSVLEKINNIIKNNIANDILFRDKNGDCFVIKNSNIKELKNEINLYLEKLTFEEKEFCKKDYKCLKNECQLI
jgi:hypothetical protein